MVTSTMRSLRLEHLLDLLALLFVLGQIGCKPEFEGRFSELTENTVLAAQSQPAQAGNGANISYRLLVASPAGTLDAADVSWAFCTIPKPISEINDITTACFQSTQGVTPFGSGLSAQGQLPSIACRQFGPDIPIANAGQPPGRPADPDATGGFYQPVVLSLHSASTTRLELTQTRLQCGLGNASADQALQFQRRSKPNENTEITSVTLPEQGNSALTEEGGAERTKVAVGSKVKLRVTWPDCPLTAECGDNVCFPGEDAQNCPSDCSTPHGCGGAEPYVYLDPLVHALVDRRESMRVSWFATAGSFKDDHTGRREDEARIVSSDNIWTAPESAKAVTLWVVLRDDRGGVSWKSFSLSVE